MRPFGSGPPLLLLLLMGVALGAARVVEADDDDDEPPPAPRLEDEPEPPTRPQYPGPGVWAKPAEGSGIDVGFVPMRLYAQVRHTDTVRILPRSAAYAEAKTAEEVAAAPRLREVLSSKKIQEVYTEEGYEDSGYDHGGYGRKGGHQEDYVQGEGAKDPVHHRHKSNSRPRNRYRQHYHDYDDEDEGEGDHDSYASGTSARESALAVDAGTTKGDAAPRKGEGRMRHRVSHRQEITYAVTKVRDADPFQRDIPIQIPQGTELRPARVPIPNIFAVKKNQMPYMQDRSDDFVNEDNEEEVSETNVNERVDYENDTKGEDAIETENIEILKKDAPLPTKPVTMETTPTVPTTAEPSGPPLWSEEFLKSLPLYISREDGESGEVSEEIEFLPVRAAAKPAMSAKGPTEQEKLWRRIQQTYAIPLVDGRPVQPPRISKGTGRSVTLGTLPPQLLPSPSSEPRGAIPSPTLSTDSVQQIPPLEKTTEEVLARSRDFLKSLVSTTASTDTSIEVKPPKEDKLDLTETTIAEVFKLNPPPQPPSEKHHWSGGLYPTASTATVYNIQPEENSHNYQTFGINIPLQHQLSVSSSNTESVNTESKISDNNNSDGKKWGITPYYDTEIKSTYPPFNNQGTDVIRTSSPRPTQSTAPYLSSTELFVEKYEGASSEDSDAIQSSSQTNFNSEQITITQPSVEKYTVRTRPASKVSISKNKYETGTTIPENKKEVKETLNEKDTWVVIPTINSQTKSNTKDGITKEINSEETGENIRKEEDSQERDLWGFVSMMDSKTTFPSFRQELLGEKSEESLANGFKKQNIKFKSWGSVPSYSGKAINVPNIRKIIEDDKNYEGPKERVPKHQPDSKETKPKLKTNEDWGITPYIPTRIVSVPTNPPSPQTSADIINKTNSEKFLYVNKTDESIDVLPYFDSNITVKPTVFKFDNKTNTSSDLNKKIADDVENSTPLYFGIYPEPKSVSNPLFVDRPRKKHPNRIIPVSSRKTTTSTSKPPTTTSPVSNVTPLPLHQYPGELFRSSPRQLSSHSSPIGASVSPPPPFTQRTFPIRSWEPELPSLVGASPGSRVQLVPLMASSGASTSLLGVLPILRSAPQESANSTSDDSVLQVSMSDSEGKNESAPLVVLVPVALDSALGTALLRMQGMPSMPTFEEQPTSLTPEPYYVPPPPPTRAVLSPPPSITPPTTRSTESLQGSASRDSVRSLWSDPTSWGEPTVLSLAATQTVEKLTDHYVGILKDKSDNDKATIANDDFSIHSTTQSSSSDKSTLPTIVVDKTSVVAVSQATTKEMISERPENGSNPSSVLYTSTTINTDFSSNTNNVTNNSTTPPPSGNTTSKNVSTHLPNTDISSNNTATSNNGATTPSTSSTTSGNKRYHVELTRTNRPQQEQLAGMPDTAQVDGVRGASRRAGARRGLMRDGPLPLRRRRQSHARTRRAAKYLSSHAEEAEADAEAARAEAAADAAAAKDAEGWRQALRAAELGLGDPSPTHDPRKYPFYEASKSVQQLARLQGSPHSPLGALRYALDPRVVPHKAEGNMAFYESREGVPCAEVSPRLEVLPKRTGDGEWNKQPRVKGPRLGGLGDKIDCLKVKYWGEEPLDNPLFLEEEVAVDPSFALAELSMGLQQILGAVPAKLRFVKQKFPTTPDPHVDRNEIPGATHLHPQHDTLAAAATVPAPATAPAPKRSLRRRRVRPSRSRTRPASRTAPAEDAGSQDQVYQPNGHAAQYRKNDDDGYKVVEHTDENEEEQDRSAKGPEPTVVSLRRGEERFSNYNKYGGDFYPTQLEEHKSPGSDRIEEYRGGYLGKHDTSSERNDKSEENINADSNQGNRNVGESVPRYSSGQQKNQDSSYESQENEGNVQSYSSTPSYTGRYSNDEPTQYTAHDEEKSIEYNGKVKDDSGNKKYHSSTVPYDEGGSGKYNSRVESGTATVENKNNPISGQHNQKGSYYGPEEYSSAAPTQSYSSDSQESQPTGSSNIGKERDSHEHSEYYHPKHEIRFTTVPTFYSSSQPINKNAEQRENHSESQFQSYPTSPSYYSSTQSSRENQNQQIQHPADYQYRSHQPTAYFPGDESQEKKFRSNDNSEKYHSSYDDDYERYKKFFQSNIEKPTLETFQKNDGSERETQSSAAHSHEKEKRPFLGGYFDGDKYTYGFVNSEETKEKVADKKNEERKGIFLEYRPKNLKYKSDFLNREKSSENHDDKTGEDDENTESEKHRGGRNFYSSETKRPHKQYNKQDDQSETSFASDSTGQYLASLTAAGYDPVEKHSPVPHVSHQRVRTKQQSSPRSFISNYPASNRKYTFPYFSIPSEYTTSSSSSSPDHSSTVESSEKPVHHFTSSDKPSSSTSEESSESSEEAESSLSSSSNIKYTPAHTKSRQEHSSKTKNHEYAGINRDSRRTRTPSTTYRSGDERDTKRSSSEISEKKRGGSKYTEPNRHSRPNRPPTAYESSESTEDPFKRSWGLESLAASKNPLWDYITSERPSTLYESYDWPAKRQHEEEMAAKREKEQKKKDRNSSEDEKTDDDQENRERRVTNNGREDGSSIEGKKDEHSHSIRPKGYKHKKEDEDDDEEVRKQNYDHSVKHRPYHKTDRAQRRHDTNVQDKVRSEGAGEGEISRIEPVVDESHVYATIVDMQGNPVEVQAAESRVEVSVTSRRGETSRRDPQRRDRQSEDATLKPRSKSSSKESVRRASFSREPRVDSRRGEPRYESQLDDFRDEHESSRSTNIRDTHRRNRHESLRDTSKDDVPRDEHEPSKDRSAASKNRSKSTRTGRYEQPRYNRLESVADIREQKRNKPREESVTSRSRSRSRTTPIPLPPSTEPTPPEDAFVTEDEQDPDTQRPRSFVEEPEAEAATPLLERLKGAASWLSPTQINRVLGGFLTNSVTTTEPYEEDVPVPPILDEEENVATEVVTTAMPTPPPPTAPEILRTRPVSKAKSVPSLQNDIVFDRRVTASRSRPQPSQSMRTPSRTNNRVSPRTTARTTPHTTTSTTTTTQPTTTTRITTTPRPTTQRTTTATPISTTTSTQSSVGGRSNRIVPRTGSSRTSNPRVSSAASVEVAPEPTRSVASTPRSRGRTWNRGRTTSTTAPPPPPPPPPPPSLPPTPQSRRVAVQTRRVTKEEIFTRTYIPDPEDDEDLEEDHHHHGHHREDADEEEEEMPRHSEDIPRRRYHPESSGDSSPIAGDSPPLSYFMDPRTRRGYWAEEDIAPATSEDSVASPTAPAPSLPTTRTRHRPSKTRDLPSSHDHPSHEQPSNDHSVRDRSLTADSQRDHSPRDHLSRDHSPRDHSSREQSPRDHSSRVHSSRDHSSRDHSSRDNSPRDHSSRRRPSRDHPSRDLPARGDSSRDFPSRDLNALPAEETAAPRRGNSRRDGGTALSEKSSKGGQHSQGGARRPQRVQAAEDEPQDYLAPAASGDYFAVNEGSRGASEDAHDGELYALSRLLRALPATQRQALLRELDAGPGAAASDPRASLVHPQHDGFFFFFPEDHSHLPASRAP